MSGLITEIQAGALSKTTSVTDLLRMALTASKKLSITDMEQWIAWELDGYPSTDDLPDYRKLTGIIRVWNPYHGWQPLHMQTDLAEAVQRLWLTDAIAELENTIAGNDGMVQYALPAGKANALMKAMDFPLEPRMFVSSSSLLGIVEAVRNHILRWTLELEKKGVSGEGLTFTPKEVQAASQVHYVTNIGVMTNSQLQQHSSGSQALTVNADLAALRDLMGVVLSRLDEVPRNRTAEAKADAETVIAQVDSQSPKPGILRESLKSLRSILENAAGSALASDVLPRLTALAAACGVS